MISNLNFKLKDFGQIRNADMNLGKINIVGGLNSSGKSTSSKILYSFLRANSNTKKEVAEPDLVKNLLDFTLDLLRFSSRAWIDDDENCEKVCDKIEQILDSDSVKSKHREVVGNKKTITKQIIVNEFDVINKFYKLKDIYQNEYKIKEEYRVLLDKSYLKLEELVTIFEEDGDDLFKTVLNSVIKREFGKNTSGLNDVILSGEFNNEKFCYSLNVNNDSEPKINGWFVIEDVFYIDSFSILDGRSKGGSQRTDHIQHVFGSLGNDDESQEWGDEIKNKKIVDIFNQIKEITGGMFVSDEENIIFQAYEQEFLMKNTASGIKQLGIIQMLLDLRKLKENCFLIIDEPEVNLHPEWQVKYAQILTLLAKELDITLYINTHSPLFIEAIRTYSKKYDLLDDTNFYLTLCADDNSDKYEIKQVPTNDLNIIFNTLGKPYKLLSKISIETEFKL